MKIIEASNVNDAYAMGLDYLLSQGEKQSTRAGDVLAAPCPVTTVYQFPWQRVLFDERRDANPFFHLFEAIWMLAGRFDATWLDRFVSDFSARYAEEGGKMHGAYGFRWRNQFASLNGAGPHFEIKDIDQIVEVGTLLRKNPGDRRVVIQMWDPDTDLGADVKDVPCNLCMVPRIIDGRLDITVMNRSNDAVWGAYGANAVHMSVLQEVLAGIAGVNMGRYYQVSNNFHVYTDVLEKIGRPSPASYSNPYLRGHVRATPIHQYAPSLEEGLKVLFDSEAFCVSVAANSLDAAEEAAGPWFRAVVYPMYRAYLAYKSGDADDALTQLRDMDCDWGVAGGQWVRRRLQRRAAKTGEK